MYEKSCPRKDQAEVLDIKKAATSQPATISRNKKLGQYGAVYFTTYGMKG